MKEFNYFCSINEEEMECVQQELWLANFENPIKITMTEYLASEDEERDRLDQLLLDNGFKYYRELPESHL